MAEKATQNLYQNRTQTYIAFLQIISSPLWKKQMYPVMHNVLYLKHVALERRPTGTVLSCKHKCPAPGSYGFRFQFQVDETLKDFWISYSKMAMERSASLKNERNPEENFENIILARNEANRIEKHRTKKITKKRRIRKFMWEESPMMTQVRTLVYFAQM